MMLGSTVRVASIVRPEAFSIVATIDFASSSESSYEVVSSTESRFSAWATSASSSTLISWSSPALPFCRDEPDEVAHELVGVDGDLGEHLGLARRVDLGVAQERAQLGHLVHRGRDRGEVACHRVDTVRFPRGLEERAGVHAVRDRH